MPTGLRLDTVRGTLGRRLAKLKQSTQANEFRPELERFVQRTLQDCIAATPARALALIQKNQHRQYEHRVNYIPSFHALIDPSLIVNELGEEWLYYAGKWFKASEWHLPDEVWAAYQELQTERNRRLSTIESDFVAERAQALELYRKSWGQVALSLGLTVNGAVMTAHSRHNPRKEPAKAYGQWRGGKSVLSVVIRNPFLDIQTKYFKGNGKAILAQAMAKNRPAFNKSVNDKMKRNVATARQVK